MKAKDRQRLYGDSWIRRHVPPGEKLPRGYGVAWHDPARRLAVCYPIGLNRLFGLVRRTYWALARPLKPTEREGYEQRIEALEREVRVWRERDDADHRRLIRLGKALARRGGRL